MNNDTIITQVPGITRSEDVSAPKPIEFCQQGLATLRHRILIAG